ncbi:MAG: tetratricopeptide repeat protein [Lentisphaeria bacterium]|nr:tetratricopeptide repeat protein [Lentisphaeria bacterium]
MKKERKTLCILLAVLLVIISATIILAVRLDKSPDMQSAHLPGDTAGMQKFNAATVLNEAVEKLNNKEFAQAENLLNAAIKQHPANTDLWLLLGTVYYRQEKFEQAELTFRHTVRRKPDSAAGFNNLCETLIKLGRLKEARSAIGNALRLAPKRGEILLNAASLYALLKEDKKALQYLHQALDNGIKTEEVSQIKELVSLLERPEFMNFYKRQTRQIEK